MAKEVFNRYENKFLIDDSAYYNILDILQERMELDKYSRGQDFYTISNIYYDTEDNNLIRNSLSKPKYKEKIRIRAYGIPKEDDKVFFEIKKKYCGIVNKRRTKIKLKDAYDFTRYLVKPAIKPYMNGQVINEIEYALRLHGLVPKLYLAYDRKALTSREQRGLRITFDTKIRTRRYDLRLESGDYGEPLLVEGKWLMEIKAERNIPLWITKVLSEHKVYSTSFSKYGREYEKQLMNNMKFKEDNIICLNHFSAQQQLIPQCP